jgi:hypothetical protein
LNGSVSGEEDSSLAEHARIACAVERLQFGIDALIVSGNSRAGQLINAQYKNGTCERSDASSLFSWKEDNPDYGLVR